MRERRFKAIHVNPEVLLHCFTFTVNRNSEWFQRIRFPGLPDDYEVIGVNYDPCYQAFLVTIYHESFPEIPESERIPVISGETETVKINKFHIASNVVTSNKVKGITVKCWSGGEVIDNPFDKTWRDKEPML